MASAFVVQGVFFFIKLLSSACNYVISFVDCNASLQLDDL